MPPMLKASFHSLPLLGLSHPGMQDTQKPIRGEEAELEGHWVIGWPPSPNSCPDVF